MYTCGVGHQPQTERAMVALSDSILPNHVLSVIDTELCLLSAASTTEGGRRGKGRGHM